MIPSASDTVEAGNREAAEKKTERHESEAHEPEGARGEEGNAVAGRTRLEDLAEDLETVQAGSKAAEVGKER
jgi:hypothetical protein